MTREIRALTALRGFAALWVVAHHAQPGWMPGLGGFTGTALRLGYVAVDIFFVLSGFIMASVHADITPGQAPAYWRRRALRVYPLHLCVMAWVAVQAAVASAINPNLTHPWSQFPGTVLLLQSYLFDGSAWDPPSWSIGVELGCYALFPFVMPVLHRLPRWLLWPLALLLAAAEWRVLAVCGGAIVGPGALLRGLVGFTFGVVLSRLDTKPSGAAASLGEALALAGMLGGIVAQRPAAVGLGGSLLILVLAAQTGLLARLFSQGWCVWLGTVSFSIYLLHAPLIGMMDRHLPLPPLAWLRGLVLLAILLPLSDLSYRCIEQPARRLRRPSPALPPLLPRALRRPAGPSGS